MQNKDFDQFHYLKGYEMENKRNELKKFYRLEASRNKLLVEKFVKGKFSWWRIYKKKSAKSSRFRTINEKAV